MADSSPASIGQPDLILKLNFSVLQRGTAEQWIKEGKNAAKWTRLPAGTEVSDALGTAPVNCKAFRFTNPPPLPLNVPLKVAPVSVLVTIVDGNCAIGMAPVNWDAGSTPSLKK
jgi:hypothetical protein